MVKLIWTESARYDLQDIHDYIALDSKKYASLTIRKLFSLAQEIRKIQCLGDWSLSSVIQKLESGF